MAKGKGGGGRGGGGGGKGGAGGGATGPAALTIDNLRSIFNDVKGPGGGASIADLRREFYDRFDPGGKTSTDAFDGFLKQAQLSRQITLTRKDDPQSITDRDRRNAVTFGGDPRHVVYFR